MAQSIRVNIVGDSRSYQNALRSASSATHSAAKSFSALKVAAVAGVVFGTKAAFDGINKMVDAASDMNETVSKTQTVFGKSGDEVTKWGENLAATFGLSKQQALDAAAIFGTFGKAAGVTGKDLKKFSEPLVQAAGDLASFHNVPVAQALEDIRSGLSGEVEPLRKYGILLNDAALRSEALKLGLVKTTKEALSPANKMLAAQKLILQDLGPASGDFARTAGSAANQQRILAAESANLAASLGQKLLPAKIAVLKWTNEHWPQIKATIEAAVNGIGYAITNGAVPAIKFLIEIGKEVVGWFQENWPKIQQVAVSAFNRIAPVVVSTFNTVKSIIMGTVTVIQALWAKFGGQILAVTKSTFEFIKGTIQNAMNVIRGVVNIIGGLIHGDWSRVWKGIQQMFGGIVGQILNVFRTFGATLKQLASAAFQALLAVITATASSALNAAKAIGVEILHGISNGLTGLVGMVQGWFQTLWAWIKGAANSAYAFARKIGHDLVHGIWDGITGAAGWLWGKLKGFGHSVAHYATLGFYGSPQYFTYYLGKDLVAQLVKGMTDAKATTDTFTSNFKSGVTKGLGNAAGAIIAAARKVGVDARAALAVAMSEGGTSFGGPPGDNGTSFGPFQLHIGGASPFSDPSKAAAFANSIKGITYALRLMAEAGAKGKSGFDAIRAIVYSFERPANPAAEVARALSYYKQIPEQLGGALEAAGGMTRAQMVKTLTQIGQLVHNASKVIGLDHARQIVAGLDLGAKDIVARTRKALAEAMAAAKQAVLDAKAGVVSAFRQVATEALSAYDEVTAQFKSPSSILLASMQAEDAKAAQDKAAQDAADTVQAAQDAANAARAAGPQEGETPEQFAARLAALDQAYTDAVIAQGATLRGIYEEQLGERATAEETAWATHRAKLREQLAGELLDIQTSLQKHPEEYAKAQRQIIAVLKRYHVPLFTAGQKLASRFADGFDEGIDAVVAAARRLVAALEQVPGVHASSGGGGGGGPSRPPDVGNANPGSSAFRTSSAGGTVNVYVQGDVTGDEVVQKVQTALRRQSAINASNPLAARG